MSALQQDKGLRVPRDGRSDKPSTPWLGEIYAARMLDLPGEEWRDIDGYRTRGYQVSNLGRLRRKQEGHIRLLSPTIRNAAKGKSQRYLRSELVNDEDQAKTVFIHKLVALAFHGEPQLPDLQVAHLNGNSVDNRAENLTWATAQENSDHKITHGTLLYGDDNPGTKLCKFAINLIHHLVHEEKWTFAKVANVSGTSTNSVARIAQGKLRKLAAKAS